MTGTPKNITLCLILSLAVLSLAVYDVERLLPELELTDLELVDICEDLGNAQQLAITKDDFSEEIEPLQNLGHMLRDAAIKLKEYESNYEILRNWTLLTKPGDGLLPKELWNRMVNYTVSNEELNLIKRSCVTETENCINTQQEYQSILQTEKNPEILKKTWSKWQEPYPNDTVEFSSFLQLVKEASVLNEFDDTKKYWEHLNDKEGSYESVDDIWEEIKPFYMKLHQFVKVRLEKYFNRTFNEPEIPVYLLGSNFGDDWTYIADRILPHPQIHFDINTGLNSKSVQDIYKLAENVSKEISLGPLGKKFWENSIFNSSVCKPRMATFCNREFTQLFDCSKPSFTSYLDAYEAAFRIALKNQDYISLMRTNLRYSAIDEAVADLGSIFAIDYLPLHGILIKDIFSSENETDSNKMTKLLLTALRVLPKLPYHLAVDQWRLQEIESPTDDVGKSWWNKRKEYQVVTSVSNDEFDFLGDSFIIRNKPYLTKFFGTLLAFQLIQHYKLYMTEPGQVLALEFGNDANFRSMIRDRSSTDWPTLLLINYGFSDISAGAMLEYFQPLEEYLNTASLEQAPIVTTTTTTTTSTTTTSKPPKSKIEPEKKVGRKVIQTEAIKEEIQLDEAKINGTERVEKESTNGGESAATYAGVGLLVLIGVIIVIAIVYKKTKKRRRTNNRRFDP